MDYHHLLEATGTVVSGLLFYSLAYGWLASDDPRRRPLWVAGMGLAWGGLAVVLMISRIKTVEGVFVDGRVVVERRVETRDEARTVHTEEVLWARKLYPPRTKKVVI